MIAVTFKKLPNNAFVDEKCVVYNRWFDACFDYIYAYVSSYNGKLRTEGYLCYKCGEKKEKEQNSWRIS